MLIQHKNTKHAVPCEEHQPSPRSDSTNTVTYSCDQCEFKTDQKEQMDLHQHTTSVNKHYSCEQCEYRGLENETELSVHIEIFHNSDPDIIRRTAIEQYGSDEELNVQFAKEQMYFSKLYAS